MYEGFFLLLFRSLDDFFMSARFPHWVIPQTNIRQVVQHVALMKQTNLQPEKNSLK